MNGILNRFTPRGRKAAVALAATLYMLLATWIVSVFQYAEHSLLGLTVFAGFTVLVVLDIYTRKQGRSMTRHGSRNPALWLLMAAGALNGVIAFLAVLSLDRLAAPAVHVLGRWHLLPAVALLCLAAATGHLMVAERRGIAPLRSLWPKRAGKREGG